MKTLLSNANICREQVCSHKSVCSNNLDENVCRCERAFMGISQALIVYNGITATYSYILNPWTLRYYEEPMRESNETQHDKKSTYFCLKKQSTLRIGARLE